jgi:hypothetical protein
VKKQKAATVGARREVFLIRQELSKLSRLEPTLALPSEDKPDDVVRFVSTQLTERKGTYELHQAVGYTACQVILGQSRSVLVTIEGSWWWDRAIAMLAAFTDALKQEHIRQNQSRGAK